MAPTKYDLEELLLEFAADVVMLVDALPATRTGNHIAGQFYVAAHRLCPIMAKRKLLNRRKTSFTKCESA